MATYLPGVTDYIPQFQPFQPDYNFLGNFLQTKQSQYDTNYAKLSKTYGTLLNSPMLREDTIQKRNEFFKMIDGDIKRISGMDLSLQRNVDSANAVFGSLYENKDIVKDMVFTKEYRRQLEIGEAYRNCIDQEQCGGKYWDVGRNALDYRAKEFTEASQDEMMTMSPGRYVPMINIQEKAMKYAKELIESKAFGQPTMTWDPSGRYLLTTTGGAPLATAINQLLMNQYAKDQNIMDMFKTQAYVQRKGYIEANAERLGGADLAEDEYFRTIDLQIYKQKEALKKQEQLKGGVTAKQNLLEKEVKSKGSTGNDDLAIDFQAAGIDLSYIDETLGVLEEQVKIADSIFEAGDNRKMKRQRVDALMANAALTDEISRSAIVIGELGKSSKIEADPYAKSLYDHNLEMARIKKTAELRDRSELFKKQLEIATEKSKKLGTLEQILGEEAVAFLGGSTSGEGTLDEIKEELEKYEAGISSMQGASGKFVTGFAQKLVGAMNSTDADQAAYAKSLLKKWIGDAYNEETNKIRTNYGAEYEVTEENLAAVTGARTTNAPWLENLAKKGSNLLAEDYAEKGKEIAEKEARSVSYYKDWYDTEGKGLWEQVVISRDMVNAIDKLDSENLSRIRTALDRDGSYIRDMFGGEGGKTRRLSKSEYVELQREKRGRYKRVQEMRQLGKTYGPSGRYVNVDQTRIYEKEYDEYKTEINEYYNGSHESQKIGDQPVIQGLYSLASVGGGSGGKFAGKRKVFNIQSYNTMNPAFTGLAGFFRDWQGQQGKANKGVPTATSEASTLSDFQNAKDISIMMSTLMGDMLSGKYDDPEDAFNIEVSYQDVALSDEDTAVLYVNPSQDWLKKYKGGKGKANWADRLLEANGASLYINKDNATNDFTQSHRWEPYDIILKNKDINLETENGGKLTLHKETIDGIRVSGEFFVYDASGNRDGSILFDQTYSDASGSKVRDGFLVQLNEINSYNQALIEGGNPKINDPRVLQQLFSQSTNAGGGNRQFTGQLDLPGQQMGIDLRQMSVEDVRNIPIQ